MINIFEQPAGVLVKTTLVDYPGLTAGSFFLKGCNLRCPYCYNVGLVRPPYDEKNMISVNELFAYLEKRQGLISGLVISGGEPLINPLTPHIIKKAKSLGYKIKLDTNGTMPQKLKAFVEDKDLRPNFIAMDLKTSPARYAYDICKTENNDFCFEKILSNSIEIIKAYDKTCCEWRTVLVPTLTEREDIKNMASFLPKDACWQFAQFQNTNCLNKDFNNLLPFSDAQANELVEYAKSFIPNAHLR